MHVSEALSYFIISSNKTPSLHGDNVHVVSTFIHKSGSYMWLCSLIETRRLPALHSEEELSISTETHRHHVLPKYKILGGTIAENPAQSIEHVHV